MANNVSVTVAEVERPSKTWFPISILSLILLIWLFAIHVDPEIYEVYGAGIALGSWIVLSIILFILFILILGFSLISLPSHETPRDDDKKDDSEVTMKAETGVASAPAPMPNGPQDNIVDYPDKVSGVVYGDTFVPVGDGDTVKLRTMLVRSCMICDHQDACWDKVKGKMKRTKFLRNIDCKQGLKVDVKI